MNQIIIGNRQCRSSRHFPTPQMKGTDRPHTPAAIKSAIVLPRQKRSLYEKSSESVPAMASQSQLTQLANLLTSSLATLQEEWKAANIPEPSLDPTSPDPPAFISVKADKASRTVLGAAKLLTTLVQGPYRTSTWQVQEVPSLLIPRRLTMVVT